jgi:uncharacterized protein (TIGR00661 family)
MCTKQRFIKDFMIMSSRKNLVLSKVKKTKRILMKILYAVQATGNGHISRAHELYPYLRELGELDILLSGTNATMKTDFPVRYKAKGLSLFYSNCGGLDYMKSLKAFNYNRMIREARDLPVEKYDLIINDFDHITARACRLKKVPSVQLGHQASFMSSNTPRPSRHNWFGEWVLKNYAPAETYVGFHFDRYDSFIFPPVIKQSIIEAKPEDHGHITVYTPAYLNECHEQIWRDLAPIEVHWFLPNIVKPYKDGNIHFFPISQQYFNESLIHCFGLVTGGGFETPSEAMYLGKKLLTIPISSQYEQQCNAQALVNKGITRLSVLDKNTVSVLHNWIRDERHTPYQEAAKIKEILTSSFFQCCFNNP